MLRSVRPSVSVRPMLLAKTVHFTDMNRTPIANPMLKVEPTYQRGARPPEVAKMSAHIVSSPARRYLVKSVFCTADVLCLLVHRSHPCH